MTERNLTGIEFPCLCIRGSTILPLTKEDFMRFDYYGVNADCLLLKMGARFATRLNTIITSDAYLIEIRLRKLRRRFLSVLAPVIDFTIAECSVSVVPPVSVSELLQFIEPLKQAAGFNTGVRLRRFLSRHTGREFDQALFAEFWNAHCPRVDGSTWSDSIEIPTGKAR